MRRENGNVERSLFSLSLSLCLSACLFLSLFLFATCCKRFVNVRVRSRARMINERLLDSFGMETGFEERSDVIV